MDIFDLIKYVDVVGISKGKGFQGVMKRWNFGGQCGSHGTERKHRSPGGIGGGQGTRGHGRAIRLGKKMAGHLGDERVTAKNLAVVGVDKEKHLLLVKGTVPGERRAGVCASGQDGACSTSRASRNRQGRGTKKKK